MHAALIALAALSLHATPASATDALKIRDAEIRKALPPADHVLAAAEKSKLEDLLTAAVDLPAMAKDSLGKRYAALSAAQQARYLKAFSTRFKKASEGEIDFYRNTEIAYGAETPDDSGAVQVPTTLTLKGEPTPVVYTVRKEGDAFKIVDLSVDGVGTVENYRSSFGKIVDKEGIDGLITRLQKEPPKPAASK